MKKQVAREVNNKGTKEARWARSEVLGGTNIGCTTRRKCWDIERMRTEQAVLTAPLPPNFVTRGPEQRTATKNIWERNVEFFSSIGYRDQSGFRTVEEATKATKATME
jgi:hypothetical protein